MSPEKLGHSMEKSAWLSLHQIIIKRGEPIRKIQEK
jgi:hypothetical protein